MNITIGYLTPGMFSTYQTAEVNGTTVASAVADFARRRPAVKVLTAYHAELNAAVERLHTLLREIAFRDWQFTLEADEGSLYLVATFSAECVETGRMMRQRTRKWRLSQHMTDGEVVQTALLAVLTANEHEAREDFTWKGERIFGPHFDVSALHALCRAGKTEHREEPA
ncbi:MAG TPA: hypothetical protein VF614_09530 [Chthoniobacteraceae bacterium]